MAFVFKAFAAEARKYPGCRVGVFWECAPSPDLKPPHGSHARARLE